MRVYTRDDVNPPECEHEWGALLCKYVFDDLDKREAAGAGVQSRHAHCECAYENVNLCV